jgi:hypothetical protein
MESNTRSPIYSDFAKLLEGIVTVRAFSAERRFLDNLHLKIDVTTKVKGALSSRLIPVHTLFLFLARCGIRFGWSTGGFLPLNFDALGAVARVHHDALVNCDESNGAGMAGLCITSAMAFASSGKYKAPAS